MHYRFAALAASILIAGCGGGSGGGSAVTAVPDPDPVSTPPPPASAPSNVNITNPTLTFADNSPIGPGGDMTLVWSDEFDGDALDPETWFFESGDGSQYGIPGWGNNELQWYEPDNARLEDGKLVIESFRLYSNGKDYTSARLNTRDRFAFRYGRIEARIRLPKGQGIWPAFWMMPQDDTYGTWAASGEIDIMEAINLDGSGGNTVHGTIHYGAQWPNNVYTGNDFDPAASVSDEFHTYALEWDQSEMRWYVDDVMYGMQNSWFTAGNDFPAPFNERFYIIFNVAVGGNWPGPPNVDTRLPVSMEVDYVRVYSGTP